VCGGGVYVPKITKENKREKKEEEEYLKIDFSAGSIIS
jgi:hypothetical protein